HQEQRQDHDRRQRPQELDRRIQCRATEVSSTKTRRCGSSRILGWRKLIQTRRSTRIVARARSDAISAFFNM
ncbi:MULTISPECIES: hypothetical protein, partial [unclassified Mesorhizobium]|uniref:hypothetical protein n=1 Tax=unclassified Mesorhizobium TaxID=325217 RepID=UPI003014A56E